MNLGLLRPMEVVRAVEGAPVPLQSKEGYIRQVIGWREYVWGMYWLRRDRWPGRNALGGHRDLPAAFWGAPSGWNCLDSVVDGVRRDAYAHHIQRLMVLGNTMLLAGVEPWQGVRWFQGAFIDGAEWVMAPNAAGMAMHADGGEMFTKPYAGGGSYVNRMSRYCPGCRFEPNVRRGPRACPVTALYWDFMARHRDRLAGNRRMRNTVRALDAMDDDEVEPLRDRARRAVEGLDGPKAAGSS